MEKNKNILTNDKALYKDEQEKEVKNTDPMMTDDVYNAIQSQNMGDGLLTLPEAEIDVEDEAQAEYKVGKEFETYGKYTEEVLKDIINNPSKYKMKSKKHGEMNLKDALDKGYNPDTDEFDKPRIKSKEELTEGLADSDKEAIERMTNPESANIPPEDAKALGVEDERFIKKPNQEELFVPETPAEGEAEAEPEEGEGDAAGMEALMAMMGA